MPAFGVIGGSGIYDISGLEITESRKLTTPYGEPSDRLTRRLNNALLCSYNLNDQGTVDPVIF